mmetsp:Transcript_15629/g.51024  ORF Transcript_15629/g.51024 Transcript_15629/m.51024 type:complete len:382 (+) Transcript_15629:201-1346(+)
MTQTMTIPSTEQPSMPSKSKSPPDMWPGCTARHKRREAPRCLGRERGGTAARAFRTRRERKACSGVTVAVLSWRVRRRRGALLRSALHTRTPAREAHCHGAPATRGSAPAAQPWVRPPPPLRPCSVQSIGNGAAQVCRLRRSSSSGGARRGAGEMRGYAARRTVSRPPGLRPPPRAPPPVSGTRHGPRLPRRHTVRWGAQRLLRVLAFFAVGRPGRPPHAPRPARRPPRRAEGRRDGGASSHRWAPRPPLCAWSETGALDRSPAADAAPGRRRRSRDASGSSAVQGERQGGRQDRRTARPPQPHPLRPGTQLRPQPRRRQLHPARRHRGRRFSAAPGRTHRPMRRGRRSDPHPSHPSQSPPAAGRFESALAGRVPSRCSIR